jgi:hypothetical protein
MVKKKVLARPLTGLVAATAVLATAAGCASTKSTGAAPVPTLTPLAPQQDKTATAPAPSGDSTSPSGTDSATTPSATPTPPPTTPVFSAPKLAAALPKPADLGPGWQADPDPAVAKAVQGAYGWGCPDPAGTHKTGTLPTGAQAYAQKIMSGAKETGDNFYVAHYVLFPDAASAQAAQTALESQHQTCTGTHHYPAANGAAAYTETDDFAAISGSGFSGQRRHEVRIQDNNQAVNEVANIEARSGPVLVLFSYTHFVGKDVPNRHAEFAADSDRLVQKTLQNLAAATG